MMGFRITRHFSLYPTPKRDPFAQSYGYGLHGSNRVHFVPSPKYIAAMCVAFQARWDDRTELERRTLAMS